jgi:hypothetical protein
MTLEVQSTQRSDHAISPAHAEKPAPFDLAHTGIFCNRCGREFDFWDKQEDYTLRTICGYGSRYDCSEVCLRFCCDCFDRLVDKCKISPVIREVGLSTSAVKF